VGKDRRGKDGSLYLCRTAADRDIREGETC